MIVVGAGLNRVVLMGERRTMSKQVEVATNELGAWVYAITRAEGAAPQSERKACEVWRPNQCVRSAVGNWPRSWER